MSIDVLLERLKKEEPMLAHNVIVKNDDSGSYIFDECCKKKMSFVKQNILKHIRSDVHKRRMKDKVITDEEASLVGKSFGKLDESTRMKIES